MTEIKVGPGWEVKELRPQGWSFAATADAVDSLPHALDNSRAIEADRKFGSEGEQVEQMEAASKALAHLLRTGLWGSGPFTVSLSGSGKSLYLAVTVR